MKPTQTLDKDYPQGGQTYIVPLPLRQPRVPLDQMRDAVDARELLRPLDADGRQLAPVQGNPLEGGVMGVVLKKVLPLMLGLRAIRRGTKEGIRALGAARDAQAALSNGEAASEDGSEADFDGGTALRSGEVVIPYEAIVYAVRLGEAFAKRAEMEPFRQLFFGDPETALAAKVPGIALADDGTLQPSRWYAENALAGGLLSKVKKAVSKVTKFVAKAAPVVSKVASFVPGIGTAISVAADVAGKVAKGANKLLSSSAAKVADKVITAAKKVVGAARNKISGSKLLAEAPSPETTAVAAPAETAVESPVVTPQALITDATVTAMPDLAKAVAAPTQGVKAAGDVDPVEWMESTALAPAFGDPLKDALYGAQTDSAELENGSRGSAKDLGPMVSPHAATDYDAAAAPLMLKDDMTLRASQDAVKTAAQAASTSSSPTNEQLQTVKAAAFLSANETADPSLAAGLESIARRAWRKFLSYARALDERYTMSQGLFRPDVDLRRSTKGVGSRLRTGMGVISIWGDQTNDYVRRALNAKPYGRLLVTKAQVTEAIQAAIQAWSRDASILADQLEQAVSAAFVIVTTAADSGLSGVVRHKARAQLQMACSVLSPADWTTAHDMISVLARSNLKPGALSRDRQRSLEELATTGYLILAALKLAQLTDKTWPEGADASALLASGRRYVRAALTSDQRDVVRARLADKVLPQEEFEEEAYDVVASAKSGLERAREADTHSEGLSLMTQEADSDDQASAASIFGHPGDGPSNVSEDEAASLFSESVSKDLLSRLKQMTLGQWIAFAAAIGLSTWAARAIAKSWGLRDAEAATTAPASVKARSGEPTGGRAAVRIFPEL